MWHHRRKIQTAVGYKYICFVVRKLMMYCNLGASISRVILPSNDVQLGEPMDIDEPGSVQNQGRGMFRLFFYFFIFQHGIFLTATENQLRKRKASISDMEMQHRVRQKSNIRPGIYKASETRKKSQKRAQKVTRSKPTSSQSQPKAMKIEEEADNAPTFEHSTLRTVSIAQTVHSEFTDLIIPIANFGETYPIVAS